MKKFLSHICLVLVAALGLVMAFNCVYRFSYEEPKVNAYDNLEFDEMPETLTYVNVGSSHGKLAFRYSPLGEEIYSQAFNFGMTEQSFAYDYYFLKCYEDRINEEGGVLIIPISIFSLYVDEQLVSNYASKILRYYPILDFQYMEGGNRTDYILYRYIYPKIPVIRAADQHIDTIFYLKDENDGIEQSDENGFPMLMKNHTQYDENGFPIVVGKNYDMLLRMIEFGRKHHMRVLLVTTPVQEEFYEIFGEKYIERFHSDVEALVQDIQVEYWNYEDLYDEEETYFFDSHHLNEEGASAFTRLIFNRIL